ncbi:MAG: hypothetical protein JWM95_3752 [Gemmatimonadetes bacterium]|nr:hypothetical protein [Gemmatimonadota bacterium]
MADSLVGLATVPSWSSGLLGRHHRPGWKPLRVRESVPRYENGGDVRFSQGSMSVGGEAWWSVTLSVPEGPEVMAEDIVFLQLERHGALPAGYRGETEVHVSLPRAEVDGVVALLAGVVDQAHQSGVLPLRRAS